MAIGEPPFSTENPQIHEFDSWGAFLNYVETAPANVPASERCSRTSTDRSFTGTASFDAALKLAHNGWADGERRVRDIARRVEARIMHRIVRDDINFDVEGMAFDVARYLEGEPEHWIRNEESTQVVDHGNRHIKLVVNMSASCGVPAEVITSRGAALAALVELLEYAEHRVEVWVVEATSPKHLVKMTLAQLVRVKAFDQPLEMGRLAFALAHPSMLRRLCFSVGECADPSIVEGTSARGGYGYPTEYRPDGTSVYLGHMISSSTECDWRSPEAVEAWTLAQLANQGVVLRDE